MTAARGSSRTPPRPSRRRCRHGFTIECDVQLSRDGIPIIFHDDDLDRLTGIHGPVSAKTMAELSTLHAARQRGRRHAAALHRVPRPGRRPRAAAGRTEAAARPSPPPKSWRRPCSTRCNRIAGRSPSNPSIRGCWSRCASAMPPTRSASSPTATTSLNGKPTCPAARNSCCAICCTGPSTRFDFISCRDNALDLPAVKLFRSPWRTCHHLDHQVLGGGAAVMGKADQIVFEGFDTAKCVTWCQVPEAAFIASVVGSAAEIPAAGVESPCAQP